MTSLPERSEPSEPSEPFGFDVIRDDSSALVAPVGELDLAAHGELGPAIDEVRRSGVDRLTLDLRRVSFMDSTGLRLVLELRAAAAADGFDLELIPGPPDVQRIFELSGTLDVLPFVTT